MAKTISNCQSASTVAAHQTVEMVCDLFEGELKQGNRPEIEQYHTGWEEPERSKLIFELIRLEIQYSHGERRSREDYLTRFPDHRDVVKDAFDQTIAPPTSDDVLKMSAALRTRWYLGQGGLGIVYVAEDEQLQRDTAVKFIQDKHRNDARSQEQFRIEAQLTGRLEHPGVVPVYGVGTTPDGRMFYAMRLIRGDRFDEAIAKYHQQAAKPANNSHTRQVALHELLNRFGVVCKTIAYAHNRGVVHRDIKPGNIMLGRYGETMVIDWGMGAHVGRQGIFKDSSEKTLMPGSGTMSSQNSRGGTPAFMSPEQAAAKEDIGPLSDVYSLGATLYSILTGEAPFKGNHAEVLPKVICGEFLRPSKVQKDVSKALEAICLKAMSLDPQRRYPTALALSEDIERFLADVAVTAYEEPVSRRFARWARRHRTLAQSGLVALALLTVCGAVASVWTGQDARQQRELKNEAVAAQKEAVKAQQSEQQLRIDGLRLSAELAARTIANQIDLRWRILEKEATDPVLPELLASINKNTADKAKYEPLQQWLKERVEQNYPGIRALGWNLLAIDGTHVARHPFKLEGQKTETIGQKFAYRDYFHGKGHDYSRTDDQVSPKLLVKPHHSTVIRSTADGKLVVVLSVPIFPRDSMTPIALFHMSIELGAFADLKLDLPKGQAVLLVENRKYYMLDNKGEPGGERGEGLLLHHPELASVIADKNELQYVPETVRKQLKSANATDNGANSSDRNIVKARLLNNYDDPLSNVPNSKWLAACAPVSIESRPASDQKTGWFVIVQQLQ